MGEPWRIESESINNGRVFAYVSATLIVVLNVFPRSRSLCGNQSRARKRAIIYVAFLTRSIDGSTFSRRSVVSWPAFRAPYAGPREDRVLGTDHDEAHILLDIACASERRVWKYVLVAGTATTMICARAI